MINSVGNIVNSITLDVDISTPDFSKIMLKYCSFFLNFDVGLIGARISSR